MEDFRKPIHAFIKQGFDRIWCHIAPGKARAASGDDGIDIVVIGPCLDLGLDLLNVVFDDGASS